MQRRAKAPALVRAAQRVLCAAVLAGAAIASPATRSVTVPPARGGIAVVPVSGPGASVSAPRDALVRFDQAAIRRAIGEGRVVRATLRLPAAASDEGAPRIDRLVQFWTAADGGAPSRAPRTTAGRAAAPTGHVDVDVTGDVRAFVDGVAPNYGWLVSGEAAIGLSRLVVELAPAPLERGVIRVAPDRWNFEWSRTREPFVPKGVNYFGPFADAQLEEHWDDRWDLVEHDLRRIAADGMNAVRIHLQLGRFMPDSPAFDAHALVKLDQLVGLARRRGLVLDVTGLAHYREEAIPAWFRSLDDEAMTAVEAAFWTGIAARYSDEPTIFCYDLQNEPLIAFEDRPGQVVGKRIDDRRWAFTNFHDQHLGRHWRDWVHARVHDERALATRWPEFPLSGETWDAPSVPHVPFVGSEQRWEDFITFVHERALHWTERMAAAVRAKDRAHLVTVGLVPWSVPFHPTLYSGFSPNVVRNAVDFVSIHVYPGHPESTLEEAKMTLRAAYVGLPVVLEETQAYFPSAAAQRDYYRWTLSSASGWFGFAVPRWLAPSREGLKGTRVLKALYANYRDFVTTDVPRTNVRRAGTRSITVRVADVRSPTSTPRWKFWSARTGPALQKAVRRQFEAADSAGQQVDIVLQ